MHPRRDRHCDFCEFLLKKSLAAIFKKEAGVTHFLAEHFSFGGYLPDILGQSSRHHLSNDAEFMREALREAMKTCGLPSPNPNVGAIFVKDGKIVARGSTENWGGLHGEKKAVSMANHREDLLGSTLYVGLEPCSHQGKQPPCIDTLLPLHLSRCVIASVDPHHLVAGAGMKALEASGVRVEVGLMNAEWRAWNFPFFAQLASQKPIFVGKWAQTLDGFLADDEGHSQWITGAKARTYTHWLRMKYDAVMVGAGTLIQDGPSLTVREVTAIHRQPHVIIFDPKGRLLTLSPAHRDRVLEKFWPVPRRFLYLTKDMHHNNAEAFWTKHPEVQTVILDEGLNLWRSLADKLASPVVTQHLGKPLQSVLVEGGPKLLTQMLHEELIELCHVFIAPQLMFGRANRMADPLHLASEGRAYPASRMSARQKWEPVSRFNLDADSVLEMVSPKWLPLFQSAVL